MQVKGNQAALLAACEDLARHHTPVECDVQHDKGHGRIETRTVHTFDLPQNWLPDGWQPLVQRVARVSRIVERKRAGGWQRTEETAWWIGTTALSATAFQSAIRGVMVESGVRVRQGFEGGGGLAENVACRE